MINVRLEGFNAHSVVLRSDQVRSAQAACCVKRSQRASQSSTLRASGLFNKLGFKLHGTNAINLAINIVIAVYQTNTLYLGTHFYNRT